MRMFQGVGLDEIRRIIMKKSGLLSYRLWMILGISHNAAAWNR